jgi:hypothetical protein
MGNNYTIQPCSVLGIYYLLILQEVWNSRIRALFIFLQYNG